MIAAKATKSLNYLRHTLWGATPQVKSMAYRYICPNVEYHIAIYRCQLWNAFTQKGIQLLENIQRCAARWVCGSRSDQCLHQLGWPSLRLKQEKSFH